MFKRQNTEKAQQNHKMPTSEETIREVSLNHQTQLSFPSDFKKKAGEIQSRIKDGKVVNRVGEYNKTRKPKDRISVPSSPERSREMRSIISEKSSVKKL